MINLFQFISGVAPKGVNWTVRGSFATVATSTPVVLIYAKSLFTAFGSVGGSGYMVTSPDGVTWTNVPSFTNAAYDVVWNGSLFAAIYGYDVTTSPDGVTWTRQMSYYNNANLGSSGLFAPNSIAYGIGMFLVVGSGSGRTCGTSPDGVTWTAQTQTPVVFKVVRYSGATFVAVGNAGIMYTSAAGVSWTSVPSFTTAFGAANTVNAVIFVGGVTYAVGTSGMLVSGSGTTWSANASFATAFGTNAAKAIVWTGTLFVATGAAGLCATSSDGVTWANMLNFTTAFGATGTGRAVANSGATICVIGSLVNGSQVNCVTSP